jgi:protein-S-isoprenylcysteine O-methyltransferase Ste14
MRRGVAAAGSALFFALAPGTVAGFLPWTLTGWRAGSGLPWPVRLLGIPLILAGLLVIVPAFVRFVVEGLGTPAPVAEPGRLVVGGPYHLVRNPMYVAVLLAIFGQALLLARWALVGYGLLAAAAMIGFVKGYEEPHLRQIHGARYDAYRAAVPGWIPWSRRRGRRDGAVSAR